MFKNFRTFFKKKKKKTPHQEILLLSVTPTSLTFNNFTLPRSSFEFITRFVISKVLKSYIVKEIWIFFQTFFQTGIVHSATRVACASRHSGAQLGLPLDSLIPQCSDVWGVSGDHSFWLPWCRAQISSTVWDL